MGDCDAAIEKLQAITAQHSDCFAVWHALTEVLFSEHQLKNAFCSRAGPQPECQRHTHQHQPILHLVALGDKEKAEHYGAQARMLGWKDELKSPPQKEEF